MDIKQAHQTIAFVNKKIREADALNVLTDADFIELDDLGAKAAMVLVEAGYTDSQIHQVAASAEPGEFQFAVRIRAKAEAPFGQWSRLAGTVTGSRAHAEAMAAAHRAAYPDEDTSIVAWSVNGY